MPRYRLAVSDLFKARGFDTGYKVGKAMNKPPAQASRLIDPNRSQINDDLVNELCEFFECTPGDLWVRVDDKPSRAKKKR